MTDGPAEGASGLLDALYEDDNAVLRALRAGVSAESCDGEGTTALYLASVADLPGTVRLLLAAGADPNRASGPGGGDLPLCGAACGGHAEVVEALLAAGADPGLREEFGFTALRWAVGLGHARVAEILLAHGADPDLPGPQDESPLLVAARRGSVSTVRVLLRYGARDLTRALEEARRTTDVERELRGTLRAMYGDVADDARVRRTPVDGGVTLTLELLRDGEPYASVDRQTGHGAIATLLESELGLRAPFEELAARALRQGDPGSENWLVVVGTLWERGDEETFQAAAAWTAGGDPLRRVLGVDVLARLGFRDGAKPFAARAVPLLRELAREPGGVPAPRPAGEPAHGPVDTTVATRARRALGQYEEPTDGPANEGPSGAR
ncbi:ankyrin repeat domain-containing protein [Streptomyces griseus]|uniref:ankyrin repeat domain-containing protein n=1 Tax=Streptomyces griseus TaxID=1911 RepID=UPI0009A0E51B|nr:ankyrin repeat domain-containing protein [Streptomyces griseus]